MKKANKIMFAITVLSIVLMIGIISVTIYTISSNKDIPHLNTPVNLKTYGHNVLTWDAVDNALSYLILIETDPLETNENSFDLNEYLSRSPEKKSYEIKIKAIGDGENYYDSEWSRPFRLEIV